MNCNNETIYPECDMSRWECIPSTVIADADNYYTKYQVDSKLAEISGGGITSGEVQTMIDESISGKLDTDAFDAYSAEVETNKQDALIAGHAISIDSANTISFTLPISGGSGVASIVEGASNTASGQYAHSEGFGNRATNTTAHAEGMNNEASAGFSHAGGRNSKASQMVAFAHGSSCQALMTDTFSINTNTKATNESEFASGRFNVSHKENTTFGNSGNTLFSVGNGTAETTRHNAFEVMQDGSIYITSGGSTLLLQDNLGGGGGITSGDVQNMIDESVSGKVDNDLFTAFTQVIQNEINEIEASGMTSGACQALIDKSVSGFADDVQYNQVSHMMEFTHHGVKVYEFDASPFLIDGMIESVVLSGTDLVISFNTDGGSQVINIPLASIFDPSNYYNKTETDALLNNKASVWCGSEAQWSLISGGTLDNSTIYLVY